MNTTVANVEDAVAEEPSTSGTRRALTRLAAVLATICALAMLTYVVPALTRFRPYRAGDAVPFASLFRGYRQMERTAAYGADQFETPEQIQARLADELGSSVAANFGEIAVPSSETTQAEGNGDQPPAVHIASEEYAGIEQSIEDPDQRGMTKFYEALLATAEQRAGALTRVGHWGDSSIATDLITVTMRRRLQKRFGDGGHGFILIARGTMPYLHRDVYHRSSSDWETRQIVMNQDREGRFGYGGVQFRATGGSNATFGTDSDAPVGRTVARFDIFYQRHPAGGTLRYRLDDGELQEVSTRGEQGDGFVEVRAPDGPHSLSIRAGGGGQLRLYGIALEREGPGVVYDSLGMVGARARRMLAYDEEHLRAQLDHRDVDLLVLGFGGNEAGDPMRDGAAYEAEYGRVIRRMRAGRENMGCLVFAPLDQAQRDEGGSARTMTSVPIIVAAQRAAALREGCAFYDTFAAMGGEGAMSRWVRSRPALAMSDLRHATPAGYEVIGNMLYKAMLKGFAEYLQRTGHAD